MKTPEQLKLENIMDYCYGTEHYYCGKQDVLSDCQDLGEETDAEIFIEDHEEYGKQDTCKADIYQLRIRIEKKRARVDAVYLQGGKQECCSDISWDTECQQWDDCTADCCIICSLRRHDTIHDTSTELLRML